MPKSNHNATAKTRQCPSSKLPVIGLGASAGGLEAYKTFFSIVPDTLDAAFVLILHLDPQHESHIQEVISRYTEMPVLQVNERLPLRPNHVYVIPPNRNLAIKQDEIYPCELSKTKHIRTPIDFFFRSMAMAQQECAIAIILSGTLNDGSLGIRAIKEQGGIVIAQSIETAHYESMPQHAIRTGLVDFILPVEAMPEAIIRYLSQPYSHGDFNNLKSDRLHDILVTLQSQTEYDFHGYKQNTLIRRIKRRMGLLQVETMDEYNEMLKRDPQEAAVLIKDLLIGVTEFFRDPPVWEAIQERILTPAIQALPPQKPWRIWIPGCASGEEAYSLAILLRETFDDAQKPFSVQIFATDIDEDAIAVARSGLYPENAVANVPPERLQRFFTKEAGEHYRITQELRESVTFAVQNLIADTPFSNLDMISCRNLLIYLEPEVQQKVLQLFHFALRSNGYLALGSSGSVGTQREIFEAVSKDLRIYRSVGPKSEHPPIPILPHITPNVAETDRSRRSQIPPDPAQILHEHLLRRFAPAAVLVNREHIIVQFYGPTEKYLNLPQGKAMFDVLEMAKPGLRTKLRTTLYRARRQDDDLVISEANIKDDPHHRPVRITASSIAEQRGTERLLLITFEDVATSPPEHEEPLPNEGTLLARQLMAELVATREDLQSTIEELETSNEELKVSNEENITMNEELQSSNEELETSREELQSVNEELNTINAQLQEKLRELENTNNDLINLMNSTNVATIFLDTQARIRRFTPAARQLFNLIPGDVGRPISDLSQRFFDPDLPQHTRQVLETSTPRAQEVRTEEGTWHIRRVMPFRTQNGQVDGVVLTFSDVTRLKQNALTLLAAYQETESILESVSDGFFTLNNDLVVTRFNRAAEQLLGRKASEVMGKPLFDAFPEARGSIFEEQYTWAIQERQSASFEIYFGVPPYTNWYNVRVYPYEEGIAIYFQVTTKQKQNESEIAHLASFPSLNPNPVIEITLSSEIIFCNPGTHQVLAALGLPDDPRQFLPPDLDGILQTCAHLTDQRTPAQFHREIGLQEHVFSLDMQFAPEFGSLRMYANDITERKRAEEALRESEERHRRIFESDMIGIGYWGPDGEIFAANDAYLNLIHHTRADLEAKHINWQALTPPEYHAVDARAVAEIQSSGRCTPYEKEYLLENGTRVPVIIGGALVRPAPMMGIAFALDITLQKQTEEALRKSELMLKKAQAVAHVGSWAWHIQNNQVEWSDEMYRIFGIAPDTFPGELGSIMTQSIHPDDRAAVDASNQSVIQRKKPIPLEYRILRPDGTQRAVWAEAGELALDKEGNPDLLTGIVKDITEQKQAEEQLRHALQEKEMLLRELYHRTKNNMNVIIAILSLQADYSEDDTLKTLLHEVEDKIHTMALVHQKLYQSQDLSRIDLQEYIVDLGTLLMRSHRFSTDDIALDIKSEKVLVPIDIAIPCGLVLNELFSNAFKHAFPPNRKGKIRLILASAEDDDNAIELTFSDNGSGVPADFDFRTAPTLGMQTIFTVVEHQLRGSVRFDGKRGVTCHIRFNNIPYAKGDVP